MKNMPTLFKISGTGKTLQWSVSVAEDADSAVIKVTSGQVGGKLTDSFTIVTKGKNIGRSNETTPLEQAEFEAKAKWAKQKDKAYRITVEEATTAATESHKPMLAHKWDDKHHTLPVGKFVHIQAKLDGMRCLARKLGGKVLLTSRSGKPVDSVPHINSELNAFMKDGQTWDGELYAHGIAFEEIISICKKKAKNLAPNYAQMQYHVFDSVSGDTFVPRYDVIFDALTRHASVDYYVNVSEIVVPVPSTPIQINEDGDHEDRFDALLEKAESDGYEGIIIRRLDLPYEHKRTIQLIKLKSFQDAEYRIVGSEEGKAGSRKAGILQTFVFASSGDVNSRDEPGFWDSLTAQEQKKMFAAHLVFKATLKGSEKKLRAMWGNRNCYVGKSATVVFQELTKYGQPRFGKVKAMRDED